MNILKNSLNKTIESIKIVTKSFDIRSAPKKFRIINQEHLEMGEILKSRIEKKLDFNPNKVKVLPLSVFNAKYSKRRLQKNTLIITIGGDGTFLNAAHSINCSDCFILGINSKPESSIGKLCSFEISKSNCDIFLQKSKNSPYKCNYTIEDVYNISDLLCEKLENEEFEILRRKRIRIRKKNSSWNDHEFPLGRATSIKILS